MASGDVKDCVERGLKPSKCDPKRGIQPSLSPYNGDNCGMWRNPERPTPGQIVMRYMLHHREEYLDALQKEPHHRP